MKAPPPFIAAFPGNLNKLPSPTAEPATAKMTPRREAHCSVSLPLIAIFSDKHVIFDENAIPARTGIKCFTAAAWIPACAGKTAITSNPFVALSGSMLLLANKVFWVNTLRLIAVMNVSDYARNFIDSARRRG